MSDRADTGVGRRRVAGRRRPRRRTRARRLAAGAAPGHRPADRGRHGGRRRRVQRAAARASSACCRPATCGWRWPRCAATTTGDGPGARSSSTGSAATGDLHGHAVGNLLIVALWELLDDPVDGLDWVGRLLGAQGRVLPMAAGPARDRGRSSTTRTAARRVVRGQVAVATAPGRVVGVAPGARAPPACPQAVAAVARRRLGGPRTGLLVHQRHPAPARARPASAPCRDAGAAARGRSTSHPQPGETDGFSPETHLEVLAGARTRPAARRGARRPRRGRRPRRRSSSCAARLGAELVLAPRGRGRRHPPVTTPTLLAAAFRTASPRSQWQDRPMAMTAAVKDELAQLTITAPCCRKAEVSAMLRFAGGLHIVSGRIVVEAELDTGAAARRLRKDIAEVYGHGQRRRGRGAGRTAQGQPLRRPHRPRTARRWPGRPVCSTAAAVRSAGCRRRSSPARSCDAEAAWRGAFLAHGSLTEPGRSSALEITCPGPEAALALVGAARRLGIARQGPRGARRRPGRRPRRRRHRRPAHPAGRARQRAGLGGAPDAPRGAGHRQPAGQLRRRQPAPLRARGGRRRRPRPAGAGDPRRRRPRPPARPRASCASSTSRPASRSSARWPTRR